MVDPPGDPYAKQVGIYAKIVALYPLVQECKAIRRKKQIAQRILHAPGYIPVVDRDLVVLSLVTKAVTTHAAIKLLADAGFTSDAAALSRVRLENVILLEWLLRAAYRIELYAESDELHVRHLATIVGEHYTHRPDLTGAAQKRAAIHQRAMDKLFGDTERKWARRLGPDGYSLSKDNVTIEGMFEELAQPEDAKPGTPKKRSFMGDYLYFETSGDVHTTAISLRRLATRIAKSEFFALAVQIDDPHQSRSVAQSLATANRIGLVAVAMLNKYAGLDLDEQIEAIEGLFAKGPASA